MALGCPPYFSANFTSNFSGFNSNNTIHTSTFSSYNGGHRSSLKSSFHNTFGTCFSNFTVFCNPQGPAPSANPYIISKVKYNNTDVILDTQDNNQKIQFDNNYINVYPIDAAFSMSQYPDIPLSTFLYNAPYFINFSSNLYQKQSNAPSYFKIVDNIYYCIFFIFDRSFSGNEIYGYDYPEQFSSFSVYSPDLQLSNFFDQYAQFYYTNDSNGKTYFDNLTINEINSFQFYDIEENQTFFYKNDQFAYIQENITTTPTGILVLKAKDETSLTNFLNSSPSSLIHILLKAENSLSGYNYMVQQVYIPEYIRNNFSFISLTDSTTKYLVKNGFSLSYSSSKKKYYNTNNIIRYNSEENTLVVLQRSPTLSTASSTIIQNEINNLYT